MRRLSTEKPTSVLVKVLRMICWRSSGGRVKKVAGGFSVLVWFGSCFLDTGF